MLASRQVIAQTGLAGFVTGTSEAAAFLAGILAQVDIWFIWEIVMILIGIEFLSGLRRSKCWVVVGIAFLIMLFLFAFPHVISSMISRISSGGI
jgi:predicted cobalt transporter CbtA